MRCNKERTNRFETIGKRSDSRQMPLCRSIMTILSVVTVLAGIGCKDDSSSSSLPANAPPDQPAVTSAENSPFGIFAPFQYKLDDPAVSSDTQIVSYLADLNVPWIQEMYFTPGVQFVPDAVHIYSRVGAEGGVMPATCLSLDDPLWVQYEQAYAAALGSTIAPWKDRITYFEVGTEPSGFPPPTGWKNCEANYADHLKTTYTVVKKDCPECKVVYGGLPGVAVGFDETFYPAQFLDKTLAAGAGNYTDAFEFKQHHYRASDYKELRNKYEVYAAIFARYGIDLDTLPVFVETAMYDGDPCEAWNGSVCADAYVLPPQSETEQAAGLIKTYVYGLASGIDRIFWNLMIERYNFGGVPTNVFNMYGLINNPDNDGGSGKKLAYFTFKKMIEKLDGGDWDTLQAVQESDDLFIYRITKNGNALYVAWWDYFNDAAYEPGKTRTVSLSGLGGSAAVVTETVPRYGTGAEVTDYSTAFVTSTLTTKDGSIAMSLGQAPVFVELLP